MYSIGNTVNQLPKQPGCTGSGGVDPCACIRLCRLVAGYGLHCQTVANVQIDLFERDLGMT